MRRLNKRLAVILLIAFAVFVGIPAVWLAVKLPRQRNVAPLMAKAAERAAAGDVDEAILRYRRVLQIDPRCDAACVELGTLFEKREQFGPAIEQYRRASQVNPQNTVALERLGSLAERLGIPELLQECATRLLSLNPDHADAHFWSALGLAATKAYDKAIEEAKRATALNKDDVKAIMLVGDIQNAKEQYELAEKTYREALKRQPANVDLLVRLGRLYETRKDAARSEEKAKAAFDDALKANPSATAPRLELANLYLRQRKPAEAEKQLVAAIERNPKDRISALAYAGFLMDSGRLGDARKHLERTLEAVGEWPEARALMVEVLLNQGKVEEAAAQFAKLPPRSSEMPPAIRGRYALLEGRLRGAQGKTAEAVAKLREAVHLMPSSDRAQVHFYLGLAYAGLGEYGSARASFEDAARLDAWSVTVQRQLATASLASGQHDVAIEAARKVLAKEPDDEPMRKIVVQALTAKGDLAAATAEVDAAAKTAKDKAFIALERAGLLVLGKQFDKAEQIVLGLPAETRASAPVRLLLADIYHATDQVAKAESELKELCRTSPAEARPHELLASLYQERGNAAQAEEVLAKYAKAEPKNASAHLALARFYRRTGRLDDALGAVRLAEQCAAGNLAVADELVGLLLEMKRPDEALAAAKKAADARPSYLEAGLMVPRALMTLRRWSEAIPLLETMAKEHPDEAAPAYLLGKAYLSDKNPQRASESLRKVVSLRPDWLEACHLLAEACFRSGDYTEAVTWSERVLARRPELRSTRLLTAFSYAQGDNYPRAIQEYLAAEPDKPSAEYFLNLAGFYQRVGQADKAEQAMLKAQALDPKSLTVALAMVSHYDATGKAAEAEKLVKRLQDEAPKDPDIVALWGRHCQLTGRSEEAEKAYRAAAEMRKDSAGLRVRLGDFLMAAGRAAEAAEEYRRALDLGSADARPKLVAAMARLGRVAEARREVEAGLKTNPNDAALHVQKARILFAEASRGDLRKKLDECRIACAKAIQIDPGAAEAHLVLAESHLADRPPREIAALPALQEAVRRDPDLLPARLRLARLLTDMNNLADAEKECRRVLALAPSHFAALETLAEAMARRDSSIPRLAITEALAKEFPRSPARHVLLGRTLYGQRKWEESVAEFRAGLAEQSSLAEALDGIVRVLVASGKAAKAAEECEAFLKRNPDSAPGLELLGAAYLANKEPAKAAEAFEAAARKDPAEVRLVGAAANAYAAAGRFDKATQCCQAYLEAWPQDSRGRGILGSVLAAQGKLAEAEAEFANALELDGDSVEALRSLAATRIKQKRFDQALSACRAFQKAHPNNARALDVLAQVYEGEGKLTEARVCLEDAQAQDPKDLAVRNHLASLYLRLKVYDRAAAQYEEIAAARPDWPAALNNLAWALLVSGRDSERAKRLAAKACELDPQSPSCLDTLGWICHKRGEYAEALTAVQRSLAIRPDSPTTRYHLAATLAAQRKVPEAMTELRRSIAYQGDFSERDAARGLLEELAKQGGKN